MLPPGARKPRFTREQIAAAALALVDRDGFEALSMRRLADELGAGTMTLYHYVRTKDDLLTLIDDALMAKVVTRSQPLPDHWRAAVAKLARATRDTFVDHPWALVSLQGARVGPNGLRHIEQSLAAVASLPCDQSTRFELLLIVDDYVFGHVLRTNDAMTTPALDAETAQLINEFTREQLRDNEFPQLEALIGGDEPMTAFSKLSEHATGNARFELGLEALLDGLALRFGLPDAPTPRGGRAARRTRPAARRAPRTSSR